MKNNNYITKYCVIENQIISVNGEKLYESTNSLFSEFAKEAYQHFEINYPKFFKMDNLSKLSFLAAEMMLRNTVDLEKGNNIAIVFANQSASLDTDVKHQESIADKKKYYPSPATFVYTLPNICVGEISIRHKLMSENAFFVFEEFNAKFMSNYANLLLNTNKADRALCGWVEFFQGEYKTIVYLVEKEGELKHEEDTINKIFNQ